MTAGMSRHRRGSVLIDDSKIYLYTRDRGDVVLQALTVALNAMSSHELRDHGLLSALVMRELTRDAEWEDGAFFIQATHPPYQQMCLEVNCHLGTVTARPHSFGADDGGSRRVHHVGVAWSLPLTDFMDSKQTRLLSLEEDIYGPGEG